MAYQRKHLTWSEADDKGLSSKTQWQHRGFRVRPGEQPKGTIYNPLAKQGYGVYAQDQCDPIRQRKSARQKHNEQLIADLGEIYTLAAGEQFAIYNGKAILVDADGNMYSIAPDGARTRTW